MKVLILAAGYGTRLESDIKNDTSGLYAHLAGKPKPLVPVGGRALASHWLEYLAELKLTGEALYVVTNKHNHAQFEAWADTISFPKSHLLCDGSTSNATRLGAIADIAFVIDSVPIVDDDLLIIGGDTLFYADFHLKELMKQFDERKDGASFVLWYHTADTKKTGILLSDPTTGLVNGFLEKPDPNATASRQACPCFYLYRRNVLPMIKAYVKQAKALPELDAPGTLVAWLHSRTPIYAYPISGRFDIGGLDTYIAANDFFTQKLTAAASTTGAAAATTATAAATTATTKAATAPVAAAAEAKK